MKNMKIIILILMVLFFVSTNYASSNKIINTYNTIENNLLVGLSSDNTELKISCAYFLGQIQSDKAIIPLMRMLKNSDLEEERIIAALSLSKIESAKGIFAIKKRITADDSERVQRLCKIFYNNYIQNKLDGTVTVEPFNIADLNIQYKGIKLVQFIN